MGTTAATDNAGIPYAGQNRFYLKENTVVIPATATTGDIYELLTIPAKTRVLATIVEIVSKGTATGLTANIGITGDDADGFDAGIDLTAANGTSYTSAGGTDAYATATGKYVTTQDTIDAILTVNTMTVGATVKAKAICINCA